MTTALAPDATGRRDPSNPPPRPRAGLPGKVVRCLSVSVVTTLLSLTTLGTLTAGFGMQAWRANVLATAAGTVPSFELDRRWVWGLRHRSDLRREVLPFWAMSFAGLALSTLAVDRADHLAIALQLSEPVRTLALLVANVATFGVLWIAQFVILDRVLFRRPAV